MATHTWMNPASTGPRAWTRRTAGRRAADSRPRLENLLAAVGVIAWAWCAYELIRALVH